jgi:hypothetical protein
MGATESVTRLRLLKNAMDRALPRRMSSLLALPFIGSLAACSVYDDGLLSQFKSIDASVPAAESGGHSAAAPGGSPAHCDTTQIEDRNGDCQTIPTRQRGDNCQYGGKAGSCAPAPVAAAPQPPRDDDGGQADVDAGASPTCSQEQQRAGACTCDQPSLDSDRDAVPDCEDACPSDPYKVSPGVCGCGRPDSTDPQAGSLFCDRDKLVHRYSFDGSGSVATDSVGAADGSIIGADSALQADGAVALSGGQSMADSAQAYVALPASVWSGLRSATFECWLSWKGQGAASAASWQRIFDFADRNGPAVNRYIYATPQGNDGIRSAFSLSGSAQEIVASGAAALPLNTIEHVAVVVDDAASSLTLYVDGASQGSVTLPGHLSQVQPANLWLGRSSFDADPAFFGALYEFRIYSVALSADQLRASFAVGPDFSFGN